MRLQVTGPEKLPLKMTPFGIPPVPLPVTTNDPPAANVPPICKLPLLRAAVENAILPRFPVTSPNPSKSLTAIRVEPLRLNPALLPLRVPALLVKSTELANPATGSARASKSNHNIRFIANFLHFLVLARISPQGGERELETRTQRDLSIQVTKVTKI